MRRILAEAWLASATGIPEDALVALPVKQRRTMSRSAELATAVALGLQTRLGWQGEQPEVGFFMGVGGSSGLMSEVERLIADGLDQAHPLYAFQLMNNFTHAHPAIALGIGGPNMTFFSRGPATWDALEEALFCPTPTLVGGADTSLHPVMSAELARAGNTSPRGEAAALIALAGDASPGIHLTAFGTGEAPRAEITITEQALLAEHGNTLAAMPALGWAIACEALRSRSATSAVVTTHGRYAKFEVRA